MMTSRIFSITLIHFAFASGCVVAPYDAEEDDLAAAEQGMEVANGTDPTFFWQPSTQSALVTLASSPLLSGSGDLTTTSLATTASGRSLLGYVIACALPPHVTVHSPQAGASFSGLGGLTPEWTSSPLSSAASQRWMTACLLQTLNGLGAHVPIRMSGGHPGLADAPDTEVSSYTIHDATTFGNIFLPGRAHAYVCTDAELNPSCDADVVADSFQRICGASPTCKMKRLGPCSHYCTPDANDANGRTCTRSGQSYPEAISTTLQVPGGASLCDD
jgi:hypothetical protein